MEKETNATLEERMEKKRIELEKKLKKPPDFRVKTFFVSDYKVGNYFTLPLTNDEIENLVAKNVRKC